MDVNAFGFIASVIKYGIIVSKAKVRALTSKEMETCPSG